MIPIGPLHARGVYGLTETLILGLGRWRAA